MSPPDLDPPPSEEQSSEAASEDGHISFVDRLRRTFGADVDPRITLQESVDEALEKDEGTPPADEESSSGSSTSRGLLRKLSGQISIANRYDVKRLVKRLAVLEIIDLVVSIPSRRFVPGRRGTKARLVDPRRLERNAQLF